MRFPHNLNVWLHSEWSLWRSLKGITHVHPRNPRLLSNLLLLQSLTGFAARTAANCGQRVPGPSQERWRRLGPKAPFSAKPPTSTRQLNSSDFVIASYSALPLRGRHEGKPAIPPNDVRRSSQRRSGTVSINHPAIRATCYQLHQKKLRLEPEAECIQVCKKQTGALTWVDVNRKFNHSFENFDGTFFFKLFHQWVAYLLPWLRWRPVLLPRLPLSAEATDGTLSERSLVHTLENSFVTARHFSGDLSPAAVPQVTVDTVSQQLQIRVGFPNNWKAHIWTLLGFIVLS